MQLNEGHLHSPYFIFVRATGRLSDREILRTLGLDDFVPSPCFDNSRNSHIYLTEDDCWTHIADDWFYNLWHRGGYQLLDFFHEALTEFPVFACHVGDSDLSFGFRYYSSGRLVRSYDFEDRFCDRKKGKVLEDYGEPLPLEVELADLEVGKEQQYVLSLASELGVKITHRLDAIRCYAGPRQKPLADP